MPADNNRLKGFFNVYRNSLQARVNG